MMTRRKLFAYGIIPLHQTRLRRGRETVPPPRHALDPTFHGCTMVGQTLLNLFVEFPILPLNVGNLI